MRAFSPLMRHPWALLAALAMVALAFVLSGTSRQAGASDWCSGGVCQEWVARYSDPSNVSNLGAAVAVDAAGNVYVTGQSAGSGTGLDYATKKYDAGGEGQWVARYNGPANGDDMAYALAVDGSGNVYVTGESRASGPSYNYDYATVMYNSAGVQQWAARYHGPFTSRDVAVALAVDGSGNVYVTGYSAGSGTSYDYATVKYNSGGVQQWVRRYDGANNADHATALAVDGSGNVYVTGRSAGSGNVDDYATVKYSSAGVQQWAARYDGPGSGTDQAQALAVDGSGNVYVTGNAMSGGVTYDYATVKYDTGGTEKWVVRYNGPTGSADIARAVAVDGSGNVYVTGYSMSGASYDYATLKYDADGVEQWPTAARYDGPAHDLDMAWALAVDGSGNVYVTGGSTGSGTSVDYATVMYDAGGVQQWVARYDGPGSSDETAKALAIDSSGNVYVTGYSWDRGAHTDYATVKYSTPVFSRVAGQYKNPGFSGDNGAALNAQLDGPPNGPGPHGLYETGTGSSLYLADTGNDRVRWIDGDGIITTVAGGGAGCAEPCSATDQSLNEPYDVFVDKDGNIYIADTGNNRIREVDTGGTITTVAGGGPGCVEPCQATQQSLNGPRGVAVDEAGNIYIADTENHRIREVDPSSGNITTVVGDGTQGYSGDGGPATSARLNRPHDVYPYGPMYAGTSDLLIADTDNNVIRWLYGPSGVINTLAGGGGGCAANNQPPYDGCPAIQAQFNAPEAVTADASLVVFVADTQNDLIRRFAPGDTIISTLAGGGNGCAANGTEPYYGCPAIDVKLNGPAGVAAGSLAITDSGSATISEVDLALSEPGGSFGNASSCGGGVATVDWVFVVFALGLILARSRVGGLLMRIRGVAGLSRRPGITG